MLLMRCIAKGPENQLPLGTRSSSSRGMPGVHGPRKLTGVSLGYGSDVWNLAPFLPPSLLPHLLALSYVNINIYIYSLYFFFKWLTGPNFSIQRLTPCTRDWKLRVYLCNSVFSASTADRPERFERMLEWTESERESARISLLNISKTQGEKELHTSRIRARPAAQLESLIHRPKHQPG